MLNVGVADAVALDGAALEVAAPVDRPRSGASLLDKVEGRGCRVAAVAPATGETLLAVTGDCKPGQFLLGPRRAGLRDFDHVGTGDAALDVAAFLAACPPDEPLGRDVLAGYGAGGEPAPVVAWYRALALLTKAERAFARSSRSPRPAALLADAHRSLDHAGLRP